MESLEDGIERQTTQKIVVKHLENLHKIVLEHVYALTCMHNNCCVFCCESCVSCFELHLYCFDTDNEWY